VGRRRSLTIQYTPKMSLRAPGDWRADPIGGLTELRTLQRALDKATRDTVAKARDAGHSWTEIGEALEMTRQSAWERFSNAD
jgi:hypothetical protein